MKHLLLLFSLLSAAVCTHAVSRDSLIVSTGPDGWGVAHYVIPGETIFSLSRRYHVPPAVLAEANGKTYADGLAVGSMMRIPLGAYNMLAGAPGSPDTARPLYYRVAAGDKLYHISDIARISPQTIAAWNALPPGELRTGKILLVGWMRCDAAPGPAIGPPQYPPAHAGMVVRQDTPKYILRPPDTVQAVAPSGIPLTPEQLWNEQTSDGKNIVHEKGSAGFFNISGNAAGAAVYAFYNAAARGTLMQVRNLNNGRVIYVKVLGPLPQTKQYAGCVLGLSNAAKDALGVRENRAFCEMSYAGF